MLGPDRQRALLERFCATGVLRSARLLDADALCAPWAKSRSLVSGVEGSVDVAGREVGLRAGLCARFPNVLPQFFIAGPDALGALPHVEANGRICYRPDEGLLLDAERPLEILEEALAAALVTLEDGLTGANWLDFAIELEAYWRHSAKKGAVPCYLVPDDALREVWLSEQAKRFVYVADSAEQVREFMNGQACKQTQQWAAVYVPLLPTALDERFRPDDFSSTAWTKDFVWQHLSTANRARLEKLARKERRRAFVVLGIPRPGGGRGLVALDYQQVSGGHPLVDGTSLGAVRRVSLDRRDRAYMVERGGAELSLAGKHVIVAGCGAVGGYLAHALAWAGIGRFTLVDTDTLTVANTFRHVLGKSARGQRKVEALRDELKQKIPYVKVEVLRDYIDVALDKGTIDLANTDLLVCATGDGTVTLHVNGLLYGRQRPALLFTWLEPYGLGGHALLTNTGSAGARGCFRCLFSAPEPGMGLVNRADLAAPGQLFAKDLSGCASMYTPYADLDARRTAETAARLAIDFLRGEASGHPLVSWKGDDRAFRAAGFGLSERYALTHDELDALRTAYAREDCPVCGGRA